MIRRIVISIILALLPLAARAQAVPFVAILHSSENLAMGGAHIATPDNSPLSGAIVEIGADKIYWRRNAINYNLTNYAARVGILPSLCVGLDVTTNAMEEMTLYNENGQRMGTTLASELCAALNVTYAPLPTTVFRLTGKYIRSALTDNDYANCPAVDIGGIWKINGQIAVGAAIENLGPDIDYGYGGYPLPATAKVGVYGRFSLAERHELEAAVDLGAMPSYATVIASIGTGYTFNDMLALRLGAHLCSAGGVLPSYFSAGIFFKSAIFDVGAAYLTASGTYSISARLKL